MTIQDSVSDVERLRAALEAQMEAQDENLPNSIARERGLVWLEGWFDLSAALAVPINKIGEDVKGSFVCPVCGEDKPHHHTPAVVDAYQNKRSRS